MHIYTLLQGTQVSKKSAEMFKICADKVSSGSRRGVTLWRWGEYTSTYDMPKYTP